MLIIAVFLTGVCIGIGFCSLVLAHSRYEAKRRELEAHFEQVKAETSAKYANLRSQIKVGGVGNVQENEPGSGLNSQVQIGGVNNKQSIK